MNKQTNQINEPKGMLTINDLEGELTIADLKTIIGGRGTAGSGSVSTWNSFKSLVFGVDANFYQDESDGLM